MIEIVHYAEMPDSLCTLCGQRWFDGDEACKSLHSLSGPRVTCFECMSRLREGVGPDEIARLCLVNALRNAMRADRDRRQM